MRDFNRREEEFPNLREYNDYLEFVETIIFNLTNGIQVESTKRQIEDYKRQNRDQIQRNKLSKGLWVFGSSETKFCMCNREKSRSSTCQDYYKYTTTKSLKNIISCTPFSRACLFKLNMRTSLNRFLRKEWFVPGWNHSARKSDAIMASKPNQTRRGRKEKEWEIGKGKVDRGKTKSISP